MHALVFNKTKIRWVSLFLCFSLCISMTLGMVVQEPAHAELVLTATTAMVAVTIAMFTVMGITFVKTGDAEKAAKAFVQSSQEVHDMVEQISDNMKSGGSSNGGNGDGSNKIKLTAACNAALAVLFHKAKEFFHIGSVKSSHIDVGNANRSYFCGIPVTNNALSLSASELFYYAPYTLSAGDTVTIHLPAGSFDITLNQRSTPDYAVLDRYTVVAVGGGFTDMRIDPCVFDSNGKRIAAVTSVFRVGLYIYDGYLNLYLASKSTFSDSSVLYFSDTRQVAHTSTFSQLCIANNAGGTFVEDLSAVPYVNGDKYSVTDIYDLLKDKLTLAPAPIEIDYSDILKQIEENQEEQIKKTQEEILIEIGIKDALDDKNADGNKTPDNPAPSGGMPDIGGIWDYVKNFLSKALIWMQLWYSGFVLLPPELQITLWALLVITIILGVLGVILR